MSELFTAMGIDIGLVTITLLVLVIVLLVIVIRLQMRQARLEKRYNFFMRGSDGKSLEKQFQRQFNQIDRINEVNVDVINEIKRMNQSMDLLFSKYGVEKYDAFEDVGGKISFVVALLDQENTGIILNAVHSRDNCFLYLKEIFKGESYVMLSTEEVEALRKAVNFNEK